MAKFWDVARWFVDPIGSLGSVLSRSGTNSDKFDFSFDQIGNTARGIWNDWTGNTANRENIEYQKEYNEQVFNNADTQYQRTVADLRAAGLSAQLAAGNPVAVGGNAAAPQRTVGNESESIERLVGLVNSIKQTGANVAVANAQVDEANAKAANLNADTNLKNLESGSYGERTAVQLALDRSKIQYNMALTRIAQLDGQTYMIRLASSLSEQSSKTWYNKALTDLAKKDLEVRESQISLNNSNIELNVLKGSNLSADTARIRQLTENLKQEKANLVQDFANKVKEGLHLDAQTTLLLKQACEAQIDYDIKSYNLGLSKTNGIRTTDQISRILGLNFGNLDRTMADWNKFWYFDATPSQSDVSDFLSNFNK